MADPSLQGEPELAEREPTAGAGTAPSRGRLPAGVVVTAALVVLALAIGLWLGQSGTRGELADQEAAGDVAVAMAEALFAYDYQDLGPNREAVTDLAAAQFADLYAEAFQAGLADLLAQAQAVSTVVIHDVFVTAARDDETRAIVHLDSETVTNAGTRRLEDAYLEMALRFLEGAWRVEGVTTLAAADDSLAPTAPVPAPVPPDEDPEP